MKSGVSIYKPRQMDKTINCWIALLVPKAEIKKLSISICKHRKDYSQQYHCHMFELHYIYKLLHYFLLKNGWPNGAVVNCAYMVYK